MAVLPFDWRAVPDHALPLLVLAAILLVAVVGRAMARVGFSYLDVALLLIVAPLLAESDVVFHTVGHTTLAFNMAGFAIPLLLAMKFILQGKAPFVATVGCLGIVTLVSYFSSFAVPSEGVLLYYRIPAGVAILLAVILRWGVWHEAGPMAYVAGAGGVILGADAMHLHELMGGSAVAHRIVIGGAGVFDGIFLVALLAAAGNLVAYSFHRSLESYMATREPRPTGTDA